MTPERCQRLVVVAGPADPVLEGSLVFVGLRVVHTAGDVTVWAPLDWDMAWPAPDPGLHGRPVSALWDGIPCPTPACPCPN